MSVPFLYFRVASECVIIPVTLTTEMDLLWMVSYLLFEGPAPLPSLCGLPSALFVRQRFCHTGYVFIVSIHGQNETYTRGQTSDYVASALERRGY